jgi:hypothetical protein
MSDNNKVDVFAAQKIFRRTEGISLTTLKMTKRSSVWTYVKKPLSLVKTYFILRQFYK